MVSLIPFSESEEGSSSQEVLSSIVRSKSRDEAPTEELYGDYIVGYRHYNTRLFAGELPECVITMTWHGGVLGYFRYDAFRRVDGQIAHEIAINPAQIERLGELEAHQTLVHEMCHLWRHVLGPINAKGKRGTRGYHDRAWADKMEGVGLMPSSTGGPGGERTGYAIADYVIEGGSFDRAYRELMIGGFTLAFARLCPRSRRRRTSLGTRRKWSPLAGRADALIGSASPARTVDRTRGRSHRPSWSADTAIYRRRGSDSRDASRRHSVDRKHARRDGDG